MLEMLESAGFFQTPTPSPHMYCTEIKWLSLRCHRYLIQLKEPALEPKSDVSSGSVHLKLPEQLTGSTVNIKITTSQVQKPLNSESFWGRWIICLLFCFGVCRTLIYNTLTVKHQRNDSTEQSLRPHVDLYPSSKYGREFKYCKKSLKSVPETSFLNIQHVIAKASKIHSHTEYLLLLAQPGKTGPDSFPVLGLSLSS